MDARAKLLITIAYIVMMFFVNSYVVYGVIALCLVAVVLMSRVPPLKVLRSVRAIIFLLIFTFIITVLLNRGGGEEYELATFGFYLNWGPF